ncbi:MAG: hypothetical protein U0441_20720 [Polyangiaceae bacterium]
MRKSNLQNPRGGALAVLLHLLASVLAALAITLPAAAAFAQDPGEDEPEPEPEPDIPLNIPMIRTTSTGGDPFRGTLQTVRGPGSAAAAAPSLDIFPDASKVWLAIRDVDPVPIETARQGGKWLCSGGQCSAQNGDTGQSQIGDDMLRSIKLQTPTLPLPLTIWGRYNRRGERVLDFDPVLIGRRSYSHICTYEPVSTDAKTGAKKPAKVVACKDGKPAVPTPDSGELTLGLQWPKESELADFRYVAIVDSCGNARVQPFQRTFQVPVFLVASGGCGTPDGQVLRVFPSGGWVRVTAFNLDQPAMGNVVNATYRVSVPPLENLVDTNPARLLFPDPVLDDLKVDCGPGLRRAPTDGGIPVPPSALQATKPGAGPVAAPPGATPPAATATPPAPPGAKPPATPPTGSAKPASPPPAMDAKGPVAQPPPPMPKMPPPSPPPDPSKPGPQPLAHQGVVIAPEPLRLGNCRVSLLGQTKRRLVAPLALYVSLERTDKTSNGIPIQLLTDGKWIVTPSNAEFNIPALAENFDGDSRLRLTVYSDPMSGNGKVVLLSDAGRVAATLRSMDNSEPERARRLIGSVTIHSVPLCGETNFQTLDAAGGCMRAYVTVPAMLATLQVTRAPWVERPIITRSVLSAVGLALAIDRYDPVQRKAFPVAGQIGGFVQSLGDGRVGLLGYVGIAPTIPVLGTGGNTTSVGLLAGVGLEYITNENGPDEGLKPAAFLSLVVQVGQATAGSPFSGSASGSASGSFSTGQ